LHGFDRVFGCKSTHYQGQLAVGCRLDGKPINALHVLRGMSTTVHFHNKLDVFHGSFLFSVDLTKRDYEQKGGNSKPGSLFSHLPFAIEDHALVLNGPSVFSLANTIPSGSVMS